MSAPTRTRSTPPAPTWADFQIAALRGESVVEPAVEVGGRDVAIGAAGELTRERLARAVNEEQFTPVGSTHAMVSKDNLAVLRAAAELLLSQEPASQGAILGTRPEGRPPGGDDVYIDGWRADEALRLLPFADAVRSETETTR